MDALNTSNPFAIANQLSATPKIIQKDLKPQGSV
jgi:hypothetical protein